MKITPIILYYPDPNRPLVTLVKYEEILWLLYREIQLCVVEFL